MRICSYCGQRLGNSATICNTCGNRLTDTGLSVVSDEIQEEGIENVPEGADNSYSYYTELNNQQEFDPASYAKPLTWTCGGCGRDNNTGMFCPICGSHAPRGFSL